MILIKSSSQTLLGQFCGGFCALVGVFTLTLPLPIVVDSFEGCYKNRLWRNEVAHKKQLRVMKKVNTQNNNNKIPLTILNLQNFNTGGDLKEKNEKRSSEEMTVADMIKLASDA